MVTRQVEAEHRISADPMKRCCVGASSGGIAAMNVAWYTAGRPRGFNRVVSHVGCQGATHRGVRGLT